MHPRKMLHQVLQYVDHPKITHGCHQSRTRSHQRTFCMPLGFCTPASDILDILFSLCGGCAAQHDAYSCRWTRASQAMPGSTAQEMQKAVRQAASSARDDTNPCLTSPTKFVMPIHDKTCPSYQHWQDHPLGHMRHIVAKIPKKAIKLQTLEAWKINKTNKTV